jgi:hypothetical protein
MPFQMVSHKISTSLLMRIFHIFNFQVITYLIDIFIVRKKSQSIVYLEEEVSTYIGFWALKLRCTQWSFVVNAAFKNARMLFLLSRVGRAMILVGFKKNFSLGCPTDSLNSSLKKLYGDALLSCFI